MRILTSQWKRSLNVIAVGPGWVAAGNDGFGERQGGLEAWSIHSGEVVFSHPRGEPVRAAAFDPAGRLFYSLDEGLHIHELPSGAACTAPGPKLDNSDFALSADGRWLLVCSQGNQYGWLSCWKWQTDGSYRKLWQEGPQGGRWFGTPTISADGGQATIVERAPGDAMHGVHATLWVNHTICQEPIRRMHLIEPFELLALGLIAGGLLLSLTKRRVLVWNVQTGQLVQALRNQSRHMFTALAVHPGGRWFATADSTGTVRFWATDTLQVS
ncbi:MAG: hypothetical protein JNM56_05710, partial [Planctomycetia bacterium]|nr:hypothetical protein [Planctomycetia bacterium]